MLKELARKFYALLAKAFDALSLHLAIEANILKKFYDPAVGKSYGITFSDKKTLIEKFKIIDKNLQIGTPWLSTVVMAIEILNIPRKVKGDIIECGAWKGASTARLSLVAKLVKRRLIVADSFEGLPEDENVVHQYPHVGVYGYYEKGMYSAGLEEVKQNISKFGDISVCDFLVGFFDKSLKKLKSPLVFAFFDVDLASSMRDCLKYVWPKMTDNSFIYTDDSCDMEIVKVWFDQEFWKKLKTNPPGYVGSGCGLSIGPNYSALGYARKVSKPEEVYKKIAWLRYPKKTLKSKKDK